MRLNKTDWRVTNLVTRESTTLPTSHVKRLLNSSFPMESLQAMNITTSETHVALVLEKKTC
jgi:hypothetical protein